MVYEGARSISGAFLETIGTPSLFVGFMGVGEFVGNVLRFISGLIASYTGSSLTLWALTISGYMITCLSIPLLGFTLVWQIALFLYVLDRVGKGLRSPARDVILSEVAEPIGIGKGFGIHELLDQVGAFTGPLLVVGGLTLGGYPLAFRLLLIPGLLAIILVISSSLTYPRVKSVVRVGIYRGLKGLSRVFWIYTASITLLGLGFMHWSIASYWFKAASVIGDAEIGLSYTLAMLVDALIAVPLGVLFDKYSFKTLLLLPLSSVVFTVLATTRLGFLAVLSAIPWGIVMSGEESIVRAALVKTVPREVRPLAYGLLSMLFGLGWMVGGFIYILLLQSSVYSAIVYSIIVNAFSTGLIAYLSRIAR
ncbi:MFS transporter [Thermogladius sp. 4427co]|uniref:MFS transporter n=1 Tax=Thermogladius sp. 4427co TaxID=3450718 RepID=UPI003F79F82A